MSNGPRSAWAVPFGRAAMWWGMEFASQRYSMRVKLQMMNTWFGRVLVCRVCADEGGRRVGSVGVRADSWYVVFGARRRFVLGQVHKKKGTEQNGNGNSFPDLDDRRKAGERNGTEREPTLHLITVNTAHWCTVSADAPTPLLKVKRRRPHHRLLNAVGGTEGSTPTPSVNLDRPSQFLSSK